MKVAFENGDESDSGGRRDPSEENLTSTPSPPAETKKSHADADQIYQRAFFTINRTTVEVVLDNDLLTWADIGIDGRRIDSVIARRLPSLQMSGTRLTRRKPRNVLMRNRSN